MSEHRCEATDDTTDCPACLAAAKAVWTPEGIHVAHSDAHISMNIAHEAALEDDAIAGCPACLADFRGPCIR